jgi:hypothetical protein
MTKAEKEKAKKNQARIEAMRAAGMLNVPADDKNDKESSNQKGAALFSKKKKKGPASTNNSTPSHQDEEVETQPKATKTPDDWDEPDEESQDVNAPPAPEEDAEPADDWDLVDEDEVTAKLIAIKVEFQRSSSILSEEVRDLGLGP